MGGFNFLRLLTGALLALCNGTSKFWHFALVADRFLDMSGKKGVDRTETKTRFIVVFMCQVTGSLPKKDHRETVSAGDQNCD